MSPNYYKQIVNAVKTVRIIQTFIIIMPYIITIFNNNLWRSRQCCKFQKNRDNFLIAWFFNLDVPSFCFNQVIK